MLHACSTTNQTALKQITLLQVLESSSMSPFAKRFCNLQHPDLDRHAFIACEYSHPSQKFLTDDVKSV